MKKQSVKNLISAIAFLLIFLVLFSLVTFVVRDKRYANNANALYQEPKDTVDVLYAGSSHMLNAVFPLEIYKDTGIAGLNVGQNGQRLPETYFALQEAFRYQSPELVVLDVYMLYEQKNASSRTSLHFTLDAMRWGWPKIQAALTLAPDGDAAEYLLDIIAYHSRWKELEGSDFRPLGTELKGCEPIFVTFTKNEGYVPPARDETAPLGGVSLEYFEKILALCEENGAEVLLVALPFGTDPKDMVPRQQYMNAAEVYAREHGIPFLNYIYMVDELGLDMKNDFSNMDHLNVPGAIKLSRHLGAYLEANYELPDRRADAAYVEWDTAYGKYVAFLEENQQ